MNKPSYHSQIMNLPCNPDILTTDLSASGVVARTGFKLGHREARHAAAELAAKADATIAELIGVLKELISEIDCEHGEGSINEYTDPIFMVARAAREAINRATLASLPAAELQP